MTSAVSRPWPFNDRSTPARIVKGEPAAAVAIPASSQPPKICLPNPPEKPEGRFQMADSANSCGRSSARIPLSRFRLNGSRVPVEPSDCGEAKPMFLENEYEPITVNPCENRLFTVS